jgi:hypothetical protein
MVVQSIAVSDYIGNAGSYGTWTSLTSPANSLDGIFVPSPAIAGGTSININVVTDGTSNTLLIGEMWLNRAWYNDRTSGAGACIDNEGWVNGWDNDTIGFSSTISYQTANLFSGSQYVVVPIPDSKPYPDTGNSWTCGCNFGSAHATNVACVLCDGTVRFISYSISPAIWHALCSRNDGVAIDPSEL